MVQGDGVQSSARARGLQPRAFGSFCRRRATSKFNPNMRPRKTAPVFTELPDSMTEIRKDVETTV